MSILISTNMYQASEFRNVFEITDSFQEGDIGIEIFPMFHDDCYEKLMEESYEKLLKMPISFHGPYYHTEHSAKKGSAEYIKTMDYVRKTLCWAEKMNCRYFVFHHNNCKVTLENKKLLQAAAADNLKEISALCAHYRIPVVIENAGVISHENMLFNQEEFTDLCKKLKLPVLIDIGHVHANGWDLKKLMEDLQKQIISYHVHNNDGFHDGHRRLFDGTLDMEAFIKDFAILTPEADFVLEYSMEISGDVKGIKEDVQFILDRL